MKSLIKRDKYWLLLIAFIICVFIYTVIGRSVRISDSRLDLFWSYREVFINHNMIFFREICLNIALFIPIGYILACALDTKKYTNKQGLFFSFGYGIILSAIIEFCQYFLFKGTAEFDDIFNNTIGAIVGCSFYVLLGKFHFRGLHMEKFNTYIALICVIVAFSACIITDDSSDSIVRQLAFQATDVAVTEDKLYIDGFCFTYGYDLMDEEAKTINVSWSDNDYDILLKSTRTGFSQIMDSSINIRKPAINAYFKSRHKYPKTGFRASIDIDKLNPDDEYEIMLRSGRLTLSGNTYIKDGKIEKTPEKEKIKLNVNGTDLQKIVENGYLKAHSKDDSCVVYQYGRELIWIMDDEYTFDMNGKTRIEYQIWTTQLDKLPGYISGNNQYWDDQSYIFEEKEITNRINCGKYRVAVMKLPMDYSIAFISTGSCRDGIWKWHDSFRPRY